MLAYTICTQNKKYFPQYHMTPSFLRWSHTILKMFYFTNIVEYNCWKPPVHFYCQQKQHFTYTQEMLLLKHKELFLMILCYDYLKILHQRLVLEFVCLVHPKQSQHALTHLVKVVEENPIERPQITFIFLKGKTSPQLIRPPSYQKLFFFVIIWHQCFVINISGHCTRRLVLFWACDSLYDRRQAYENP